MRRSEGAGARGLRARAARCVEAVVHPAAPPLHPRAIAPPRELYGGVDAVANGAWDDGASAGAGREIAWGDGPTWGDEKDAEEEPPGKARKREEEVEAEEDEEMAEEEKGED